ncbi:peptidase S8 [Siansivirga zeaxanthinifaciens CC-SAMT-1]|uniref:Peptidase S8 n=2 Tax=Siansivirga TaxID=1204360 RepID=A0A0C5WAS6_9FLAO|nr:peptidase S8 [Siansivirga zeaxanthinifaciens CC-SAMT-1]
MNNKVCLFCLVISLTTFNIFSQTKAEKDKIISNYNLDKIQNLKSVINEKNKLKELRVSTFLKNNDQISYKMKINGKTYMINDIVDGKPVYITTHNLNSAKATKTDKLHTGGGLGLNLEGLNMNIGVWDEESVRGTHNEFKDDQTIPKSRVVYPEFPGAFFGPISDHATHVAGTLVAKGADPKAKGMAPKATLRSYDWILDDSEALNEAANGLLISNHSYGVPIFSSGNQQISAQNIGSYTSDARIWDDVAYNAPYYLAVNSAGNEGIETYTGGLAPGFDKLTQNKTAKNNLVVANANPILNATTGALTILAINSNSSQGPTDDFRVKPDIAGDGTNVYSSTDANDSDYSTFSGTSMASPNVAGSLLLLQEYYNQLNSNYMRASTLKGLVCHTAIDDNTRKGPDGIFGWGLLNAEDAALIIKGNNEGTALIREITINNGDTYTYEFFADSGVELRASICWTDPPGDISSSPNNVLSPRLENDLDLRLEDTNNIVFLPWKLNSANVAGAAIKGDNNVDNIERIDITNPTAGNYALTVSHKGSLKDGAQTFSLIITGANLTLGTDDKNNLIETAIWPIPTTDKLYIDFKENLEKNTRITVYNVLGNLVFDDLVKDPKGNRYSINTSKLSKGIYFLNISNQTSKYTKKIIIK